MAKRITLQSHLSVDELEARYRRAKDPVERSHFQIVWLLAQGKSTRSVAEVTGYCPIWIQEIARRYNQAGPDGLGDRRKGNPGAVPLLSEAERQELWAALHGPAPDGGLWTSRKVADWIAAKRGRPVRFQRGWEYLERLGFSVQQPRPRHTKADADAQEAFRKKVPAVVAAVRQAHPGEEVELWAEDEHRLGLKPVLRRVWAPKGQRPTVLVQPRYEWLYLYGFVRPTTGDTSWLILPTVNVEVFSLALTEFAQEVGAGQGKQVILVVDQAGWHLSAKVRVPAGIHLLPLPAASPELQPAERLWPLTNEPIANQHFADLDALEDALADRCRTLLGMPDVIRAHACFHWWPAA